MLTFVASVIRTRDPPVSRAAQISSSAELALLSAWQATTIGPLCGRVLLNAARIRFATATCVCSTPCGIHIIKSFPAIEAERCSPAHCQSHFITA
jgi:hypothetical protein